jgi:hypothetical protein
VAFTLLLPWNRRVEDFYRFTQFLSSWTLLPSYANLPSLLPYPHPMATTLGAFYWRPWPRCSGRTRACATWGRCVKYAPIGMLHSYVGIPMLQSYELICSSCCGPHSAACIMPQQDEHLKCASALAPRYSHCPAWSVQQQSNASAILWLTSCRPRPRTARSHTSYRSAPKS